MVVPIVAIDTLSLTNLASAQQDSTASSLTAQVGEGSIELSWTTVQGAARYEMWVWDSVNNWRQLGGNTLTGTSCSHTERCRWDDLPLHHLLSGRRRPIRPMVAVICT